MWKDSFISVTWKSVIVISVLKSAKDPSSHLHYRTISLTTCFIKLIFEKMVNTGLVWVLEKGGSNALPWML